MIIRVFFAALAFLVATPAKADIVSSSDGAFVLEAEQEVAADPDVVWRALTRIDRWWSSEHTYSGDARNLSIAAHAGGCFCERWQGGQSVEHARIVMVTHGEGGRALRLLGGLGPLQGIGATGVLTFSVTPHASGAKLTMTYRVSGDTDLGLDALAPAVDQVMMEQFARWAHYSETAAPA
jgi:uncharacterized protein YndB with AHSA1/START domain